MPKQESLGFLVNPVLRVPATDGSQLPHIRGHRQTPVSALGGSLTTQELCLPSLRQQIP